MQLLTDTIQLCTVQLLFQLQSYHFLAVENSSLSRAVAMAQGSADHRTIPPSLTNHSCRRQMPLEMLGAVLAQRQSDGTVRPIAYTSRSLQAHEKNYGVTELEGLGVVWAVKHFRAYLYGHHCDVYTDH